MHQKDIETNPTSVAIIVQSPILSYGIKGMLESLGYDHKIKCFPEFQDFQKARSTAFIDIVIVGLGDDSENDAISSIRQIQEKNPLGKIIVLDRLGSIERVGSFFREKVNAYLPENCSLASLEECMIRIKSGKLYVTYETSQQILAYNAKIQPTIAKYRKRVKSFVSQSS